MVVHTVLVSGGATGSTAKPDTGRPPAKKLTGAGGKTNVVRVASRDLVYSDEARKAQFTGGVEVESADGVMHAQQVMVYLQPEKKSSPDGGKGDGARASASSLAEGSGFMGGSVERMIATGDIELEQPGRRATGEQIVYTASDGMFVLTGTPKVLPRVMDDQRGIVTGTSLQLHSGDNNVVVSNRGESGVGQRVRTETRVKNKQ
jgi:lipopolysaccharide export system protein LptA